jgi:tetratricopeptide (TPR) repeat protein
MRDFYEVLGISRTAQVSEIKTAFKRLAKLYHPDRNPGNKQAEEMFKNINEAYHILINPVKKSQYDLRLRGLAISYHQEYDWEEIKKRRYYQWQKAQESSYRFDKNYFKIQGLAFLVFLIIAGFCFTVIHTAHYYVRKQQLEKIHFNSQMITQVNGLFGEGRFNEAFKLINNLEADDPLEYRYGFAKDSLIDALRKKADHAYLTKDFHSAVSHYLILKEYEHPVRLETLENMSMCQYYLGNYEESIQALKHLHNQEPYNLALIYQIGLINLEKLNNPEEALHYFTLGKKLFKQNLSHVYGDAFQIVMNPHDAPDIYYYLFVGRAQANMKLNNYKEAIKDCNWAIFLRRSEAEPYYYRAISSIKGHETSDHLCDDLMQASQLGIQNIAHLQKKYCTQHQKISQAKALESK